MKLLEVVKTDLTDPEVFSSVTSWGQELGKTTVPCKDTPGFVVNRLLVPFLFEAVRMVERDDATPQDVDVAMKLGAGHPMGPFELFDYNGHDTMDLIMQGWSGRYPDETLFRRSEAVKKLVDEGKLGRKTGEGFYKY
jgi:3-hydroxyacyl-CoA dehydrogenase